MKPAGFILEALHGLVEWSALVIDVLAVVVIVGGVVIVVASRGALRYLFQSGKPDAFESYKHQLARPMLLGLDLLVAGDIVKTVALEATLTNVLVLGLLVLVRTFLSWSLVVEIEGRWPWQSRSENNSPGD